MGYDWTIEKIGASLDLSLIEIIAIKVWEDEKNLQKIWLMIRP